MTKFKRDEALSQRCYELWDKLSPLRDNRNRNIRYKNGHHWDEVVEDPQRKGSMIREEELITREGRVALKHNFINQFVRNILGQVIKNPSQSTIHTRCRNNQQLGEMLTNTLQASLKHNQNKVLENEVCEELLVSGIACTKIRYAYNHSKGESEGIMENVNFNNLFFNDDFGDCRMMNLKEVGELHDMSYDEVILNFASSSQSESAIKKILQEGQHDNFHDMDNSTRREKSFFYTSQKGLFRVLEIWQKKGRWTKELHDPQNGILYSDTDTQGEGKRVYRHYWQATYMTSDGYVLKELETPFHHRCHPYVFGVLPFTNGEIRSIIGDLIDIQRYINRLIIMIDFIIASSAKGVLMIPESSIPDGYSVDDFTKEYVKTNGVIVYKPNAMREVPFQITSNSTNVGAWEMLSLQMNLIQQISGLSGAIQGHSSNVQMAASLYSQQTENSQLNFQVLFEALRSYKEQRDEKLLHVLIQYYKEPRTIGLCGSCTTNNREFMTYDPSAIGELLDFQITIAQSIDTPVYREMHERVLMGMLQDKHIDIEMFLRNSSLPFADNLLNQLGKSNN